MACKFICDGCGKEEPATQTHTDFHKPRLWFQRSDKDGIQVACSRDCIEKISEKTGKTGLVLPV